MPNAAQTYLSPYNADWRDVENLLPPADEVVQEMNKTEQLNLRYRKWIHDQLGISVSGNRTHYSISIEPTNIDHITGLEDNIEGLFWFPVDEHSFHMTTEDIGRAAAFGLQHDYVTGAKWDQQKNVIWKEYWEEYWKGNIEVDWSRHWKKEVEHRYWKSTDLGYDNWDDFKENHTYDYLKEWGDSGLFDETVANFKKNTFVQKQLDAINTVLNYQVTEDMDGKTKQRIRHHMRDIMKHGELSFDGFSDGMMRAIQTSAITGEKLRYLHFPGDLPGTNNAANSFFDDHWLALTSTRQHLNYL